MTKKLKDLTNEEMEEICFANFCKNTCPLYEGCRGSSSDPRGSLVEGIRHMPGEVEVPEQGEK